MTLVYNTESIRLITLFENLTGATVRDCIVEDNVVYFVVDEGKIGLAIGKNGMAIKNAEKIIGKRIKVFEFDKNPIKFVRKMIPQAREVSLLEDGDRRVMVVRVSKSDRPFVIGRDGKNLKIYKKILERNHKINDLQVR